MGKLNMRLMQGVAETEQQINKEKQSDSGIGETVTRAEDINELDEKPQNPLIASKQPKIRKNTKKRKKAENNLDTKPQKQVFSFRAMQSDISLWKAYAIASGKTMENIGVAAMKEYVRRHKLNDTQKAVFEALRAREDNRE